METVDMRSDPVTLPSAGLVAADAFRAIAELGGDIAFIIDCATRAPVYASPGVDALLGYGVADFQAQLTEGGDGPLAASCAGLDERLRRFAGGDASRRRIVREFDLVRPDGRSVAVEIISTLLPAEAGRPHLLVGLLRDLSAQRAREREQKRFASMLNHEFRTPLSTIDGAIQRLEATGKDADEPTRQRYRKIATATDRLIAMLDDYLSPERMAELGRERPANGVSPALLLDELVAQARAAGRPVEFAAGPLPAHVRGDPAGLRLVLKVFLDNALRYSPAGSGFYVTGGCVAQGIALTLRDEGPGVPPDDVAGIFDKGYRGANAAGVPGSGLGLYMARSVVEVHGGTVNYVPAAPGGAAFTMWLPAQDGTARENT